MWLLNSSYRSISHSVGETAAISSGSMSSKWSTSSEERWRLMTVMAVSRIALLTGRIFVGSSRCIDDREDDDDDDDDGEEEGEEDEIGDEEEVSERRRGVITSESSVFAALSFNSDGASVTTASSK